eukprot:TRINITY_DN15430_c0_g1_i2.p1 TRINITY_DN15430_c0_g1~~TRINITY_DN15430_c0_g1_i2.p1  ORF type:complete len:137 (-),score=16.07 TRINITY_DN15430_c0_g1_i2:16-426(-)
MQTKTDVDAGNEFRVFVHEGVVTAISQYHWYEDSGWGEEPKKTAIPEVVKGICKLFENLKPHLPFSSCVYDTHVKFTDEDGTDDILVELVEFNPFGAHISSGSALFHWVRDFDILNGVNRDESTPIYVRFVCNSIQ